MISSEGGEMFRRGIACAVRRFFFLVPSALLSVLLLASSDVAVGGTETTPYQTAVMADQPRGYWRLGEHAGAGTALDASGHGHNGTYVNVFPGADNEGAVLDDPDTAAHFPSTIDMSHSDEIQLGWPAGLWLAGTTFTVEAWVRTEQLNGAIITDDDGYHDSPPAWRVHVSDGRIGTLSLDGKFIRHGFGPSVRVDDDEWHHVVAVFDPGQNTRIYVDRVRNGKQDLVRPYVPTMFPPEQTDTAGITIGDGNGYANFNGYIDEVALYPAPLSGARVRAHYAAAQGGPARYADEVSGAGANAWWRLGEAAGATTAVDEMGESNGSYRNVSTGVPGALTNDGDTAARFGGANPTDDVVVSNGEALNAGVDDFSVTAWIKTTSATGDRAVLTKEHATGPGWSLVVMDDTEVAGHLRAVVRDGSTSTTAFGPKTRVNDGAWHHVAFVYSRTAGSRIYVDAQEAETAGAVSGDVTNTAPLRIGGGVSFPSFGGDVDEVAVYGFALDAVSIAAHYEAGVTGPADLVTEEPLDEEDTDTWTDVEETFDGSDMFDEQRDEIGAGTPEDEGVGAAASSASTSSSAPFSTYCNGPNPGPVCVRSTPTAKYVTWQNQQAWWTIYKECIGPSRRVGSGDAKWRTVGPGYIARIRLRASNLVVVDDERGPEYGLGGDYDRIGHGPPFTEEEWATHNAVNSYVKGGLGTFGWHHARASKQRENGSFASHGPSVYSIDGRICAPDFRRDIGGVTRSIGVIGASVGRPTVTTVQQGSSRIPVGSLRVDVFFTDGFVNRIVRVRYLYRIYPRVVRAWHLTTFCYEGCHLTGGVHRYAFAKEPKFTATVRRSGRTLDTVPFTRMINFNRKGEQIRRGGTTGPWCVEQRDGGTATSITATNHCGNFSRVRARFDFTTDSPNVKPSADGRCTTGRKCLNIVMLSYPVRKAATTNPQVSLGPLASPGRAARNWEYYGLDRFALVSSKRPKFNPVDNTTNNPVCIVRTSPWQGIRRWELAPGNKANNDRANPYHAATFYFHGWEGGVGFNDCEPHSALLPRGRETYAVYAQYAINSGWTIPPLVR
jgi:hypothetical protein